METTTDWLDQIEDLASRIHEKAVAIKDEELIQLTTDLLAAHHRLDDPHS